MKITCSEKKPTSSVMVSRACVVASFIIYWVINKIIRLSGHRVKQWSSGKHSILYRVVVEMLDNTKSLLIFFTALLLSIHFIDLPGSWNNVISHGWFLVLALQIAMWLDSAVHVWLSNMTREPGAARNPVTMVILGLMMRVLIWAVMMLSILGNVGVNITALVASLGVGGASPSRWRSKRCRATSSPRWR